MGTSRRLQVVAAVVAIALLAGAYALVSASDEAPTEGAGTPTSSSTTVAAPTNPTEPTTPKAPAGPAERRGVRFTDITRSAGFDQPRAKESPKLFDQYTGGGAVADFDDDGDQDVFLPRLGLPNRLLRNDGRNHFTDVAATAGVAGVDQANGSSAAVWADVDGDGHLDLFTTGAGSGAAVLYRNDGNGHFTDVTASSGLAGLAGDPPLGTVSFGAAFDDWDHDGHLDLVVLEWFLDPYSAQQLRAGATTPLPSTDQCELSALRRAAPDAGGRRPRTRLYRNDGAGGFEDVTAASGIDPQQIIGMQPRFADVDGDGWDDLFVTGDFCTSRLYRNDAGKGFVDVTAAAHVGTDENGMGSVIEDIDGDGHLDWFVTSIIGVEDGACPEDAAVRCTGNRLYLGDGRGGFTDGTDRFGVRDGSWGWGAAAADFDDDGRLDLVMADGVTGDPRGGAGPAEVSALQRDLSRFWLGTATTPWVDEAEPVGLSDRTSGKALVAFDADGDGDLDLLIVTNDGAPFLYRNDTPSTPERRHLTLRLRQAGPNPFAVGASVLVDLGDGTPPRPMEVRAGGSYASSDPYDLHVGLGPTTTVAKITIRWPGDPTPQVLERVRADQVLSVTKPA